MKFLVQLIFCLLSVARAEESCTDKNLLDVPPLSNRKNTFQDDLGWCCSFAFADSLSLKYGINVSPVDLAISQAKLHGKLNYCSSLNEMVETINKSHGICSEDDFKYRLEPNISLQDQERARKNSKEMFGVDMTPYFWKTNGFGIDQLEELYKLAKQSPEKFSDICAQQEISKVPIFKNLRNLNDISDVLKETLNENFNTFLYKLSKKNCTNRIAANLSSTPIDFQNKTGAIDSILEAIKNGKPSILAINATGMFQTDAGFFKKLGGMLTGNHAVSVVGSRLVDGKCYFKVRDSTFGGRFCEKKKIDSIICSTNRASKEMTYEIESGALAEYAKSGLTIQ